jgi:hypothetical protein
MFDPNVIAAIILAIGSIIAAFVNRKSPPPKKKRR